MQQCLRKVINRSFMNAIKRILETFLYSLQHPIEMTFKDSIMPTTKKVIFSILLTAAISFHLFYIKGFMSLRYYAGWWGLITKGIFSWLYYPLYLYATILPMEVSADTMYPNIWTYILFVLGTAVYAYVIVCILSLVIGKFKRKRQSVDSKVN